MYAVSCLLLLSGFTAPAPPHRHPTDLTAICRVNAPYFEGDVRFSETAVFWFGRVMPGENALDVRVGYNDEHLFLHVAAIDRRIWYDPSPTPETLDQWDGVTVYVDTDGAPGATPTATSHRFDAQVVWWEEREAYEVAYVGNGTGWSPSDVPFTTRSNWRGEAPNNHVDDRGWFVQVQIPFASLGLDGAPAAGKRWALAVVGHDRDSDAMAPEPDQVWPEAASTQQPATWGELAFSLPQYETPLALTEDTVTIREGLDGAVVPDAPVGGGTVCGGGSDYWTEWGDLNYGDVIVANVQNQIDIADWPCFSRYYVTFPLDALLADRAVISATLTLHHRGNTGIGWDPGPQPSWVQVLSVNKAWDEATLTWNNAPPVRENLTGTWVESVLEYPCLPGIPYNWDVSRAVAEAHAAGQPVRLAVYEADAAIQSGKYFRTSEEELFNAVGRPTLRITYGVPLPDLGLQALPTQGNQGDLISYTLNLMGSDHPLILTNTLPIGLGDPLSITITGDHTAPVYDDETHLLTWQGTPALGEQVEIQYRTPITTQISQRLSTSATLENVANSVSNTAEVAVFANAHHIRLPLIIRQ